MEETSFNPAENRCAVVTGGNRGIGLEICRQLASNGIMVILTAIDEKRGTEAVENLKRSGLSYVVFHQLDVKDPASIASLENFIKTHIGKLDILVNNAAESGIIVNKDFKVEGGEMEDGVPRFLKGAEETYENAKECLKTNYYGTKRVTEALLPLLQLSNSARIVNVSSSYGRLRFITNEKVKVQLKDVDCLTEDKLEEVLQWFLKDFKENMLQANGWPPITSAYKVSKAAINAYTRMLALKFPNLLINCIHPGYVKTDITCNTGILTPEEGARGPVMLSLLPENGPSGLYFDQMKESTFD